MKRFSYILVGLIVCLSFSFAEAGPCWKKMTHEKKHPVRVCPYKAQKKRKKLQERKIKRPKSGTDAARKKSKAQIKARIEKRRQEVLERRREFERKREETPAAYDPRQALVSGAQEGASSLSATEGAEYYRRLISETGPEVLRGYGSDDVP
ncbi:MAG: hypothetical protein MJA29_06075 [Candidatus Omnitrophica bacterium]|nr:hypothetical protein [Candidatus Omnitrophota bacterium]